MSEAWLYPTKTSTQSQLSMLASLTSAALLSVVSALGLFILVTTYVLHKVLWSLERCEYHYDDLHISVIQIQNCYTKQLYKTIA